VTELGLGTAQLGLPYGVSNRAGQPSKAAVAAILEHAVRAGIRTFDTAPAYGESEALLGRLLPREASLRIVTKTPPLDGTEVTAADCEALRRSAERSCERLRRDRLDVLLVHHGADLGLPAGKRLAETVIGLRDEGVVARLGVSVYDREELDVARRLLPLDIVQLPLSALDQRFLRDGTLDALAEEGVEVHVRSVFLQGLLLMDPEELPDRLAAAREPVRRFRSQGAGNRLRPLGQALAAVRDLPAVEVVLVGANSAAELAECVAAMDAAAGARVSLAELAVDDPAVIDPRRWSA